MGVYHLRHFTPDRAFGTYQKLFLGVTLEPRTIQLCSPIISAYKYMLGPLLKVLSWYLQGNILTAVTPYSE